MSKHWGGAIANAWDNNIGKNGVIGGVGKFLNPDAPDLQDPNSDPAATLASANKSAIQNMLNAEHLAVSSTLFGQPEGAQLLPPNASVASAATGVNTAGPTFRGIFKPAPPKPLGPNSTRLFGMLSGART